MAKKQDVIAEKYHKIISDRLRNGRITSEHRLLTLMKARRQADADQLSLFSAIDVS